MPTDVKPEVAQAPPAHRWGYHSSSPGTCPACGKDLSDLGLYFACDNHECRFYLDDGVQTVVTALASDNAYCLADACEMAREHTLAVEEERPAFRIHDDETADWYLKKCAEFEAERDQVKAMASARIKEINDRTAELLRQPLQRLEFFKLRFEAELRDYIAEATKNGKKKSKQFIFGSGGYTTVSGKTVILDAEKALAYAQALHPEWIETKAVLKLAEVKTTLQADAEEEQKLIDDWGLFATPDMVAELPKLEDIARIEDAGEKFSYKYALPGGVK